MSIITSLLTIWITVCIAYAVTESDEETSNNVRWSQNGITVAGGFSAGQGLNQLQNPRGIYLDKNAAIYVADFSNDRIMKWEQDNPTMGKIVAGGKYQSNARSKLLKPTDIVIDEEENMMIICSHGNKQLMKWSTSSKLSGEILIPNIDCRGLATDKKGYFYISNADKSEVRRYRFGTKNGTLVAGGNGEGAQLNQLHSPLYIFVDQQSTVYVSDADNQRVIKWLRGADDGIVVAGGHGWGNARTHLSHPLGIILDEFKNVYVSDCVNHRVVRWLKGATVGEVIVGGNGQGNEDNQLNCPIGLSFDQQNNLYVVDSGNHRVQKFEFKSE